MGVRRARGPAPAEAQAARYCVRHAGGRGLVRRAPLFSPDAQSLLVIAQSVVRVYNVKTAECSRVLESEGESSDLVSIGFPHDEENNLYGCSDRGRVTVWNWEKGSVLKEKNLELPDNIEVLTFDVLNRNECFITGYNTVSNATYLAKFCLKTGDLLIQYEAKNVKRSQIWQVTVGWNKEDRFSVVCNGSRFLYACDLSRPHAVVRRPNYNDIRILSVSAHPNESAVVTGDALGRAIIWKGDLFSNNVAREQLHWHSLPLIAVAFSLQGSYLLTGGMEKVVVKWQLGNVASKAQQRDTMPRLPGAVRFLVSNNTNIAIVMNNNAIAITTPQLGLVSTIMECGGLSHITRSLGPGLVYHKPLGSLLLGGRTGHLQVFSTASQKVLYNVDITGLNDIPANRYNLCPADTEVSCAAVSADGTWLVTSEYRSDGITYPEERLKFWSATPSSTGPFTLNTCVNLSHGGCNVISIAINNTGDFCVSAGTDQKFRIWKRETNILSNKKKISWSCLTACYYASGIGASLDYNVVKSKVIETENEFNFKYLRRTENNDVISRVLGVSEDVKVNENDVGSIRQKEAIEAELEMGGVAISQDGSLIAAWFGSKLTLWDTYSCSLRNTLSHPSLRPKGVDVQFGNEDAAHYLVCTTENCVAVWNLLSLTVRWLVNLRPVTLTADPSSNRMAVVTENNDVFVFTPHQATPLLSRKSVLSPSSGVIRHCAFGPSRHELEFRLYMMRNDSEMYCLEPESSPEGPALETVSRINLPASNYSALVAEKQTSGVKRLESSAKEYLDTNRLGKTALAEFFSSAPHMVPSVSLLCTSFLEHLSGFKRTEDPPEDVSVASEEPNSSDDEGMDSQTQSIGFQAKKVELWRPNYEDTKEKKVRKILREPELSASLTNSLLQ